MENMSNISDDALERIHLKLNEVIEMLTMGK